MASPFRSPSSVELMIMLRQALQEARIGDRELEVLTFFYDEKKKLRRKKIAMFQVYSRVCEASPEESWAHLMNVADRTIQTLKHIKLIQDAGSVSLGTAYVGDRGSQQYELTANGLDRLQTMHPNLALRLKGWIAVAPPWIVLLSTICGGLSALWGFAQLGMNLFSSA